MNHDRIVKLESLVMGFHDALATHDFSDSGLNLRHFPFECCHHACKLLSIFLFEQGFTDVEKRVGSRPDDPTGQHLWLSVEAVVVDTTAYQFDDKLDRVFVAKNSAWHTPLNGKPRRFGLDGERLCGFIKRAKSHYDGLSEELELKALLIISQ